MNAVLNFITKTSDKFWLLRLYRYYIIDSIIITKKYGFKELLKRRGWKFLLIIIAYYTVRDTVLYILLPYLIASSV